MAKVLSIAVNDSPEVIQQKIKAWQEQALAASQTFNAKKYTGKIKSFGDGLLYQQGIRNEWH